jgi:hypothetical protein
MKIKIAIGLSIFVLIPIFNYMSFFGFFLSSYVPESLILLWLFFYICFFPIGIVYYVSKNIKFNMPWYQVKLIIFSLYIIGLYFSGCDIFDLKNAEIRGDGVTIEIVKIIYTIALSAAILSLLIPRPKPSSSSYQK